MGAGTGAKVGDIKEVEKHKCKVLGCDFDVYLLYEATFIKLAHYEDEPARTYRVEVPEDWSL